jgi:hypothetical protein
VGSSAKADEWNIYILSMHCTTMEKGQALEPVSRRAHLLNPNQISELITDGDSAGSQCDVVAMGDKEY